MRTCDQCGARYADEYWAHESSQAIKNWIVNRYQIYFTSPAKADLCETCRQEIEHKRQVSDC